jgi:voltage-gated potassium channel
MPLLSPIQKVINFKLDPKVSRSLLLCCIIVLSGTAGFTWIEGWSAWRSLFFTLVTLTTVGYGDYGLSEQGERFTAILMIGGIASVSYAASQFIQYATTSVILPEHRMINRAKKLSGHYIICGLGRTGLRVIALLREEGVPFVAIDPDERLVERARNDGMIALHGDASEDQVLLEAGIKEAASVAAVTSIDSVNAMICLTTRAICPDIRISTRAEGEESVQKLKRAGANTVINPTRYGGDGIAQSLMHPKTANLLYENDNGSIKALQFSEVVVNEEPYWVGKKIIEFGMQNPDIIIVGIMGQNGELKMRPDMNRELVSDDILFIAGSSEHVKGISTTKLVAA